MRKLALALITLSVLSIAPRVVMAQVWLGDRDKSEGPGIKLGKGLVLHPGVGVEGGYDTNPLRDSESARGAGRLKVTPFLDLATISKQRRVQDDGVIDAAPPKVSFRLGLAGYYDWFFSDEAPVDDQDDFGLDTRLNFTLFPVGWFTLVTHANYFRTIQPYESAADAHARHSIRPGAAVRVKPGGGTLSFELGYRLDLLLFEMDALADENNRMTHDLRFVTAWKLFPKTAIISKTTLSPVTYLNDGSRNNGSLPVRSLFGLQGLVSNKFGLSLFVGYGGSFYETGENFDSVIAQGELMFFITPFSNIRLGGERNFVDSFYSNFYVKNGGYLTYSQMFGGVFMVTLKGEVFHRRYSSLDVQSVINQSNPSSDHRTDLWIESSLLLDYRITNWLALFASGDYQADISDFKYLPTDNTLPDNPVEFHRFQVFGGVRCHY